MSIVKFLKVSRILKRRTVAQEACTAHKVRVNGREVKPAYTVKVGDIVNLQFTNSTLTFEVLALTPVVKKEDAAKLYKILPDTPLSTNDTIKNIDDDTPERQPDREN